MSKIKKEPVKTLKDFPYEKTYAGTSLIYRLAEGRILPNTGVDYVRIEKNKVLQPHFHKKPKILIVVVEGKGFIHLNGKEYPVKKGSVIEIYPKVRHGFRTGKSSLVFLSIQTPPIYGKLAEKDTYFEKKVV